MEIQPPSGNPQPDTLQQVLFNQRGLRPGWRVVIAVILFIAITYLVSSLYLLLGGHIPKQPTPAFMFPSEAVQFLIVLFVSWIMGRIEGRSVGEYGLPLQGSRAVPRFARGWIFWGFIPLSLFLLVLRALHVFYFGNRSLHGIQILTWAAIWGFFFVLVGLFEEYLLRGYLLYTLAEGIGFWPAAIVLAAAFGILHSFNNGETRIGIIMTTFFAMFAAVTLRYTGSLWLAVGAHAGWDWGESYFYGVNDSGLQVPGHLLNPHLQGPAWLNGGTVGPEGSILALALLTGMSVLFVLLYRRSREPVLVVSKSF